ncbi:hypothetical protein CDL60_14080 [Roseateles noduli]|nr:hypothetical protein CDL60_14080 [Roseateles noduli]
MPHRGFVQEDASSTQRRVVLFLCALILSSVVVMAPWASMPLPPLAHISGMYGAATAMIDLATFWLLISTPRPHRSHVIVASAYLFAALMAILHVLTFPGAVLADGPVLGSPHAVSWLFVGWRAGFGFFVIWAILKETATPGPADRRPGAWPPLAAILATVLLAVASQATDLGAVRPDGGRLLFGPVSRLGAYISVAAAAVAVFLIWRRGLFRRAVYLWLAFVLIAEGAGVWLSTHSGHRYSLAWYTARVEGLLANTVVLGVIAVHFRAVQKRLTEAYLTLQHRTEQLQAQVQKREAAEAQLARAQKLDAVGRLGASLAHDLNNILQVLTGRLAIIRKRAGDSVDADVQVMRRSVKKGEALTRQLTLLSGRRRNHPRALQVGPVLREMEDALRSLIGAQCHLTISIADDLPTVALDPLELEIAVTNLATNASDSMPRGGRIRLSARLALSEQAAQAVSIEVADEGEGIKLEILEKIFEPFFTTKTRGNGTGLGLAQVQAFVTGSGGAVQVNSALGRGTSVTMTFPATHAAELQETEHHAGRLAIEGKVVLLVEDNPDVRDASNQLLSAEGLAVRVVDDAESAIALLAAGFAADFLVTDIVMPGRMNGVDLVRQVKVEYPRIRSILVTGYSDIAERAREEGFTVLRKPYDLTSLIEALS